jgi:predicted outer membrane repeat protein
MKLLSRLFLVAGCALIGVLSGADPTEAADQVVSDCGDDGGPNQLRAKLTAALSGGGTITFTCGPSVTLNNGVLPTITANITINGGGTITISGKNASRVFVTDNVTLTLNNITISNGYINGDDGGAIRSGGTLNINNSKFLNNMADGGSGGAIVSYGPLTIVNSEFAYNKAENGGALYPRFSNAITTIQSSTFHHNLATNLVNGWGGAILLWDGAPVTVNSTTFNLNQANLGGAAYVFLNSSLTLSNNSAMTGNSATHGGGIYNSGATILSQVSMSGNEAAGSGGAIFSNATVTVTNSTLSGNNSLGAGFGGGAMYIAYGITTLSNSTMSGNIANGSGGGIFNFAAATLTNVTFNANEAAFYGGGIRNGDTVTLTNVTVSGNKSGPLGGGIYNYNGKVWATNSTFSGNSATGRGGGLMNEDSSAYLSNVTFSGNSAPDGGGIYSKSSIDTVKNSLLAKGANGANCVFVDTGSFSLSDDASCGFGAGRDSVPDLNLGPLANNGGFTRTHLPLASSAAIDQAQCTDLFGITVSADQRGTARPQGLACDVGAAERVTGEVTPWLYLPLIRR